MECTDDKQSKKYSTNLFFCVFILISCADITENDEVKFKVISYGGNFNGSYSLDSATNVSFTGSSIGSDGYIYEKEVEVENQLEIEADQADADASGDEALTSLEIKIYRDGSLIKNVQDTYPVTKISTTYTVGEAASSP